MQPILAIVEHRQGRVLDPTVEILGKAARLAEERNTWSGAVLLGTGGASFLPSLRGCTHRIIHVEDPVFECFNAELYLAALVPLIREIQPSLILLPHTSFGMELAPALAWETQQPLATDATRIQWAENGLSVERLWYGGKIQGELDLGPAEGYIVTVRPGSFGPPLGDLQTVVEKRTAPSGLQPIFKKFLGYTEPPVGEVDITRADVLVAVGRGIEKAENLDLIFELAEVLGGEVACSRPVADKKWLPKDRQVGVSGKTVRPKVYIAVGISGSFQHQAGMNGADLIIAVNKDPNAPIFQVAHYGIVADLFEVIPAWTEHLKKTR